MSLKNAAFPRSAAYPDEWMMAHQMGPNAVWLTEWATERTALTPGMRVLDLGCGKALSAIFLAREFDVEVHAADWWMAPEGNAERVEEMDLAHRVHPVKAEAHQLPFEEGSFDAVVSVDAYQYFGTDELYLHYLSRFLKRDGRLAIVVPGLTREIGNEPPAHLLRPQAHGAAFWEPGCWCFKTQAFWQGLWDRCPFVDDVKVTVQEDGWKQWRDFEVALEKSGKNLFPSCAEALESDAGSTLGFLRLEARRNAETPDNLYDPELGKKAGAE